MSAQTNDKGPPSDRSYNEEKLFCDHVQLSHCLRLEDLVDIVPQAQWPEYLAPGIKKCVTNGIFKACGVATKLHHPAIAMTTTTTTTSTTSKPD